MIWIENVKDLHNSLHRMNKENNTISIWNRTHLIEIGIYMSSVPDYYYNSIYN